MSVISPVIDYIDTTNRYIYLLQGVTEYHPVEDIYKEIRYRRKVDESLRKFDMPVTAYGNIPKGGGKYTPRYARFNNGWKIVPYDENSSLYVTGEQITDTGESGPACIDTTTLTNSVIIQYEPPAAEIVRDEVSLAAIARMSFNNEIWHDHTRGYTLAEAAAAGIDLELVGNTQYPSSDHTETLAIATSKKINNLKYTGIHSLTEAVDMTGYHIYGESPVTDHLDIGPAPTMINNTFENLKISGILDGGCTLRNCAIVGGLSYFSGSLYDCGIGVDPVVLYGGSVASIINCRSIVPGGNARPQIDFNNTNASLDVRNWHGGLELTNKSTSDGDVSIDMSSGIIYIRSSCTAGIITVRGLARIVDESGAGCTVDYTGLLDPAYVQYTTYADSIWIDETSSNTGTVYPAGTPAHPLNNWTDALALGALLGIDTYTIHGASTIPATANVSSSIIIGHHATSSSITVADGATTGDTTFKYLTLNGVLSTEAGVVVEDAIIGTLSNLSGYMRRCGLTETVTLGGGRNTTLDMCFRGDRPIGIPPVIDMGGSGQALGVRGWVGGGMTLQNLNDATIKISIDMLSGRIDLSDTLVAGSIYMRGLGTITDHGHTLTVLANDFISSDNISKNVWDEFVGDHLIADTMGHLMYHIEYDDQVVLDEVNGSAGTTYPAGTKHQPCNNWPDALAIMKAHKYSKIKVIGSSTVGAGIDVSGITIYGTTPKESCVTFDDLCINDDVHCADICIVNKYSTGFVANHCSIETGTGFSGTAYNCVINGVLGLAAGETNFYSCFDGIPGVEVAEISVGDCASLGIWDYQGGLRITDMTTVGTVVSAMITAGRLFVNSTDVEGDIIVKGMANLVGTTGGTTIDSDGLITKDAMQDYIWNTTLADHTLAGTTGNSLSTASSGGVDVNVLADAVWSHDTGNKVKASVEGKAVITVNGDDSKVVNVYDTDGSTILYSFNVSADNNLRIPA